MCLCLAILHEWQIKMVKVSEKINTCFKALNTRNVSASVTDTFKCTHIRQPQAEKPTRNRNGTEVISCRSHLHTRVKCTMENVGVLCVAANSFDLYLCYLPRQSKKNSLIFKSNAGCYFWVPFYAIILVFGSGRFRCGSYHNRVNDLFNLLTIHVVRRIDRFISIFRLIQIYLNIVTFISVVNENFSCQTNIRRHWRPSKQSLDSFMTFYRCFFVFFFFKVDSNAWIHSTIFRSLAINFGISIDVFERLTRDIRNFFALPAAQLSEVNITIHRLLKSGEDRQPSGRKREREKKPHLIYYPQLNSLKIQSSINRSFNDEAQLSHHLPIGESARAPHKAICIFFSLTVAPIDVLALYFLGEQKIPAESVNVNDSVVWMPRRQMNALLCNKKKRNTNKSIHLISKTFARQRHIFRMFK